MIVYEYSTYDSQEQINICLNCIKSECDDCCGVATQAMKKYSHKSGRATNYRKAVWKVDPVTGKVLMQYKSVNEAARKTGISTHYVNKCLKGECETYGGFAWKYAECP